MWPAATAQLITTSGGEDPAWTRDSRHLVYSNNGRLHLLDTVSRESLPIETGVSGCGEPDRLPLMSDRNLCQFHPKSYNSPLDPPNPPTPS